MNLQTLLEKFKLFFRDDWRLTLLESENRILAQQDEVMSFSGQTVSAIVFIEPHPENKEAWILKSKSPADRDDIFESMEEKNWDPIFSFQEGKFYCITNSTFEIL